MKNAVIILFLVALLIVACRKNNTTPAPVVKTAVMDTFNFSYTGSMYLSHTVTFKAELSKQLHDTNIIWDFGDGSSDTGKIVTHRYSNCKDFPVSMHVRGDIDTTVTKTLYIKLDAAAFSGKRRWNGYVGTPAGISTISEFEDEVFVVSDSSVSFRGEVFVMHAEKYYNGDDIARCTNFSYKSVSELTYYYAADTFGYVHTASPVGENIWSGKKL